VRHAGTGQLNDISVAADGEGRAYLGVFRASENQWRPFESSARIGMVDFGAEGNRPIPNILMR